MAAGVAILLVSLALINRLRGRPALARPETGGRPSSPGRDVFVSQALQILTVTLAVWIFFAAFGLLTIGDATIESWTGQAPHLYALGTTTELLQVAGVIAALSGLYREEFLSEITDEMRGSFVPRVTYLKSKAL